MNQILPVAALSLILAGCSVLSPPPLMARHDSPRQAREGDVRVLLLVGVGGGVWTDPGFGVALRASVQATPDLEAGGDLTVAFNLDGGEESGHPQVIASVRGLTRYNPGSLGWLALDGGVGAGFTDTGSVFLTADTGASFGHAFDLGVGTQDSAGEGPTGEGPADRDRADRDRGGQVLVYGGPLLALSIPIRFGTPFGEGSLLESDHAGTGDETRLDGSSPDPPPPNRPLRHPTTTFYYGASAGFGIASGSALDIGSTLELTGLGALSAEDSAVLVQLSLGNGAAF